MDRYQEDLTGKKINRLTVIKKTDEKKGPYNKYICRCDCGNTSKTNSYRLINNLTKSCGCYRYEQATKSRFIHGCRSRKIKEPVLYKTWRNIKNRCLNKNAPDYQDYGGRGIGICEEWKKNPVAFLNWAENQGGKKELTIDRIDNDKGYSPNNCRFVPNMINAQNKRLIRKDNKTGYCGVLFISQQQKYKSAFTYNKKRYWVGTFANPKVAAIARDFQVLLLGASNTLNFPELKHAIR